MLRKYATLEVIEAYQGGKTKTLRREAARAVFNYEPREGYIYIRSRAISSRCNDNFDFFPAEEIKLGYKTFIGKPVFVNHHNDDHRRARGVIIDAALHEHRLPNGDPDTWVEVLMEIDAKTYPKLAKAALNGDVARTSMGTDVKFSKCSVCDNKATSPAEYCQHIPAMKGKVFYKYTASGQKKGTLCYEKCYGLSFFENSLLVEPPADPTAFFTGIDARGVGGKVASMQKGAPFAGYDDFDDCTEENSDKRDPDAYCGEIKHKVEDKKTAKHGEEDPEHEGYISWRHDEIFDPEDLKDSNVANMSEEQFEEYAQKKLKQKGLHKDAAWEADPKREHTPAYHEDQYESFKPKRKTPEVHPDVLNSGSHPSNIVNAFHEAAKDKDSYKSGLDWYKNAHHAAKAIAKHTGHDTHSVVGLMTSYSPRTLWAENLDHAYQSAKANKAISGDDYKALGDGRGRNVLPGNTKSAQRYLAHKDPVTGKTHEGAEPAHHKHLIATPKTSDFAHLIEHGDDHGKGPDRVVVDRHAMSVAFGNRITDDHPAVKQMKHRHNYEHVADHYRQATEEINNHKDENGKPMYRNEDGSKIRPHQVQAVTWQHQIKKNAAGAENDPLQKGRNTKSNNAWDRWKRTVDNDKIPLPHGSTHYHHSGTFQGHGKDPKAYRKEAGLTRISFGEQKSPPEVDTLREETCPVCQEDQLYSGDRCPVCGFVTPPSQFLDPDLSLHKKLDLRNDGSGDTSINTDTGLSSPDQLGEEGDISEEEDELEDPSALDENLAPLENDDQSADVLEDTDGAVPEEDEDVLPEEDPALGEEEAVENESDTVLTCPNCEFQIESGLPMTNNSPDAEQTGPASGDPCPNCEEAPLMSNGDMQAMDEEEAAEDEEELPVAEEEEDPKGQKTSNRKVISMNYEEVLRRLAVLELQNEWLADAAGVKSEFAGIKREAERLVRQADVLNPASPVPDPPSAGPSQTTEEALQPDAADDPRNLGLAPGSTENVSADQTDNVLTPGMSLPTSPTGPNGLQDVTAPVSGTETQLPLNQTRIETDVRVGDPDNQEKAFPWTLQPKSSSERSMASIRLAELRIQANLSQDDKFELASRIQTDASLTDEVINYEIDTLSQVLKAGTGVARTASTKSSNGKVPKISGERQSPSLSFAASRGNDVEDDGDASDLFL